MRAPITRHPPKYLRPLRSLPTAAPSAAPAPVPAPSVGHRPPSSPRPPPRPPLRPAGSGGHVCGNRGDAQPCTWAGGRVAPPGGPLRQFDSSFFIAAICDRIQANGGDLPRHPTNRGDFPRRARFLSLGLFGHLFLGEIPQPEFGANRTAPGSPAGAHRGPGSTCRSRGDPCRGSLACSMQRMVDAARSSCCSRLSLRLAVIS